MGVELHDGRGRTLATRLALHLHQLVHGHHIVVEMRHDHHGAKYDQGRNKYTESQCEEVVRLVGCARDMEEERDVHAHLRNRQGAEKYRYGRRIHERGRSSPERRQSQSDGVCQTDQVTACAVLLAWIDSGCLTLWLYLHVHYFAPR